MKNSAFLIIAFALSFFAFKQFNSDPAARFLASLDKDQRAKTQLPFSDLSRQDWHFFPGEMWPRAGILLKDLNAYQKESLHQLLLSYLSKTGYTKILKIIDLENVLAKIEDNSKFRDPEKYFVAFYGDPSEDKLWAWSFEGHHISLNFTILDGKTTIAPRFLGANPAMIKDGKRKGERTLAKEEDHGLNLVNALSSEQKSIAIFQQVSFKEIVTSVSTEVGPLTPVGIQLKDLNTEQQKMLKDLIQEYLSNMPEDLAKERMDNLKKEDMSLIRFGWAGATELGKPHYYRVQGKSFLIEFDNTINDANHIHTVWRDFNGDFGRDVIKQHYQNHH